jgi:cellulose synthase/poly-beta-1,6-N-acetylglucosamine synthase-like glycosyltransferase
MLAEDFVYTRGAITKDSYKYKLYNSVEPVYITPPLSFKDAIKQRRRWIWGHVRAIRYKFIPLKSRVRLLLMHSLGLLTYSIATVGAILHAIGIVHMPDNLQPLFYTSLATWFITRGYCISRSLGIKHGIIGGLLSHVTVTLNFLIHITGLLQGDPKRFDVIKKEI